MSENENTILFKWLGIAMSIIGVLLIACLAYLYFFVMKNEEQVEKGYQSYVKADYTQVLNDYKDLDGKILIKRHSISMRKVILKQTSRD